MTRKQRIEASFPSESEESASIDPCEIPCPQCEWIRLVCLVCSLVYDPLVRVPLGAESRGSAHTLPCRQPLLFESKSLWGRLVSVLFISDEEAAYVVDAEALTRAVLVVPFLASAGDTLL